MIAIIDYGAGNLFSVKNALDYLQIRSLVTADKEEISRASSMILPGVGAFPDAMAMLKKDGLDELICREAANKPLLGICLGMQMLFEKSYEFAETSGLGLIPGCVQKIDGGGLKVPHMGWNDLTIQQECPMTQGLEREAWVYFVHSFRANTNPENISCYTMYNEQIPALVHKGMVYGAQFHPEKSGDTGLKLLANFARLVKI